MSRAAKAFQVLTASVAVAAVTTACGTQKITVASSAGPAYQGAMLFNQRCSGCHTFSYAATYGSGTNVRLRQPTNGPNFNLRCERPVARVLYAIENGGFSGAIMPQNVVVGQQAVDVAEFVARFAGRQAPFVSGQEPCGLKPIGTIPPPVATTATTSPPAATTTTTPAATGGTPAHHPRAKAKRKR